MKSVSRKCGYVMGMPTVVAPPQSNVVVPQGGEFKLTCRAVGVPDPYINWRLNWADVCEPPRCQQVSEGGVGTLTVQNAQPLDQGAYTCEAINVKGRVLATPDCIVRIVSIPAPEPIPQLRAPPPEQRTCASPTSYQAPQGCLRCFCFGVTDKCRSSMLFRTKEKLFFAAEAQGVQLADQDGRTTPGTQFDFDRYGFVGHKEPHHGQTLYWKMPQRFLGNKVTAYGGDLSVKLLYEGPGPGRIEPLVIIRGNGITLIHRARDQESVFTPGREFTVTVPTYEQYYEHRDGRGSASREDLMMVLADLDLFMIRATHTDSQTKTIVWFYEVNIVFGFVWIRKVA
uniref:Ig-like domain-containing protein n=1 Tax=Meloidogyne hapla TaxID=6305 RepID=A0A1I8BFW3_MELHA